MCEYMRYFWYEIFLEIFWIEMIEKSIIVLLIQTSPSKVAPKVLLLIYNSYKNI